MAAGSRRGARGGRGYRRVPGGAAGSATSTGAVTEPKPDALSGPALVRAIMGDAEKAASREAGVGGPDPRYSHRSRHAEGGPHHERIRRTDLGTGDGTQGA